MRVLIEGRPGSGKTTAAARLAHLLAERNIEVRGFVTDEMRESGTRVGFTVRSFGGEAATLAHVDLPGSARRSPRWRPSMRSGTPLRTSSSAGRGLS